MTSSLQKTWNTAPPTTERLWLDDRQVDVLT